MKISYLDFEKPISELEAQTQKLTETHEKNKNLDISKELSQLEGKTEKLLHEIYDNLNAWQISQVSRHPQRPYTLDYIEKLFTDFEELHGDRAFADDPAIVGGLASFEGIPVMVIGHQKGRTVPEKVMRNFGMPRPEGYRKALRLMEVAERFHLPIITFIDTAGAYPGMDAEERGQSEAIAFNLLKMSNLRTPIIATVTGEGGSGGALAIGGCDHLNMLENSIYSVISPEGCASILWRSADHARDAAEAMRITSDWMHRLGVVDAVVSEPLGGAHRDPIAAIDALGDTFAAQLESMAGMDAAALIADRNDKYMRIGDNGLD